MSIPTPHINAKLGDFAETVLMPGDPLRSKFIAETFLTDAVLVNNVRGVQGYTGLYKGKRVSVMASGMGMPSMGIYSYELFHFYDVKNIIRIGSAGAVSPALPLRSIVIGMSASYVSSFQSQFNLPGIYAPTASYELLKKATGAAEKLGLPVTVGNILSSDLFYGDGDSSLVWQKKVNYARTFLTVTAAAAMSAIAIITKPTTEALSPVCGGLTGGSSVTSS